MLSASAALLTQLGIACRLAQNLRALEEVCGLGVALLPMGSGFAWWSISAAVAGFGMAMLYPNLSAAVADIAHPSWRASAIDIYRFWRDLGYGVGTLGLGATAALGGEYVLVRRHRHGAVRPSALPLGRGNEPSVFERRDVLNKRHP